MRRDSRPAEPARWAVTARLAFCVALVPTLVSAVPLEVERRQSCERRGITRVLELREGPERGLPCEVVYLKPDEDRSSRVLWLARVDRGFCTARFESFLVKLENKLDWTCEPTNVSSPGAASSPAEADVNPSPVVPAPTLTAANADAASVPRTVSRVAPPPAVDPEPSPTPARALPVRVPPTPVGGTADRLAALRALVPSGPYVAIPEPRSTPAGEPRVDSICPPGGSFFWNTRDPQQPIFELGPDAELAVELPDAAFDETVVLTGASLPPGTGAKRELQTLSLAEASSERGGRVIEIRVAPRGPGSGALPPSVCRYALGG